MRTPSSAASSCTSSSVALLLLLVANLHVTSAYNFTLEVTDDTRRVMDLGSFGFSAGGVIEFTVEYLEMKRTEDEQLLDPIGFTLDWVLTANHARQEKNYGKGEQALRKECFIEDKALKPHVPTVSQWRNLFPLERKLKEKTAHKLVYRHTVKEAGMYALFFYNCKGYSDKAIALQARPVSFKVRISQYNIRDEEVDYLSEGDRRLPLMYAGFFFVFLLLSTAWIKHMRENMVHVHKIHFLMSMLVILKTMTMFFEGMKLYNLQVTGTSSAWNYFSYLFLTLKGITLFLVILLLGTGWSILKPVLSQNDKHIAIAILPLQIMINIAIAVIEETSEGNRSWTYWRDMLRILDVICCLIVILPILFSLRQLRALGPVDGKVARNLVRLRQFRTFYIFFIGFLYCTRILVVLLDSILPFRLTWMGPFLQETAAVVFYLFTGMRFRPFAENPYLYLEEDDFENEAVKEEMAAMKDEEDVSQVKPVKKASGDRNEDNEA